LGFSGVWRSLGGRGWHVGSLSRQLLDASLHVCLGFHGIPFIFGFGSSLGLSLALSVW
jgi:hypothetical protein